MNTLLAGEVGSYAYGLNVEGSDHDFAVLFCNDLSSYLGLDTGSKSYNHKDQTTKEELTRYELRHWALQAAKGNPEFLQMLFLNHTSMSEGGYTLVLNRDAWLSKAVVMPFTGCAWRHYAEAKEGKKVGKNFMSALRYMRQCEEVLRTGHFWVSRVGRDAEALKYFRANPPSVEQMEGLWKAHEGAVQAALAASKLPERPNMERLSRVVQEVLTMELFDMELGVD